MFAPSHYGDIEDDAKERRVAWDERWGSRLRRNYLSFLVSFATKPPPLEILLRPAQHFIHHSPANTTAHLTLLQRIMVVYIVGMTYGMDRLEEWIMYAVQARFVEAQEPWGVWRRVVDSYWRAGSEANVGEKREGDGPVEAQLEMDRRWGSIVASGLGGDR